MYLLFKLSLNFPLPYKKCSLITLKTYVALASDLGGKQALITTGIKRSSTKKAVLRANQLARSKFWKLLSKPYGKVVING